MLSVLRHASLTTGCFSRDSPSIQRVGGLCFSWGSTEVFVFSSWFPSSAGIRQNIWSLFSCAEV